MNLCNLRRKAVSLFLVITSLIYSENNYDSNVAMLENSAQEWQDDLHSLKKYAKAAQIYLDNGAPNINEMYEELGLSPDASQNDIKKTYRKLILTLHPDKWSDIADTTEKALALEKFKNATTAYTVLTNIELLDAYETLNSEQSRLDFSKADSSQIIEVLEKAATLVEIIQDHLKLLKAQKLHTYDLKKLNQLLRTQYLALKNISEHEIIIDNSSLQEKIRAWAKSMQAHIQHLTSLLEEQKFASYLPIARTDKEYNNWLLQNPSSVTKQSHENGRTPLSEAIEAGSPQMARNVIDAAHVHGISLDTLLQPIKEKYSIDILQGKKSDAQALLDKVYALNIEELSNKLTLVAQKIHRLRNNSPQKQN